MEFFHCDISNSTYSTVWSCVQCVYVWVMKGMEEMEYKMKHNLKLNINLKTGNKKIIVQKHLPP